jgi:hypothetical protein
MRELHGVTGEGNINLLKRKAILFDNFILLNPPEMEAEWDFLRERRIVQTIYLNGRDKRSIGQPAYITFPEYLTSTQLDVFARHLAEHYCGPDVDVVGICSKPLPLSLDPTPNSAPSRGFSSTISVAIEMLPCPADDCAWQDIIDFKAELRDKQWCFRRFLKQLATKPQTESEIRDDIEWTLNEYAKAMAIHHIKASQSFFEVYVLPVIEVAENLVKFNWTKIAKGALDVKKRNVELLEAEMRAPGRECAYLFDARKRWGRRG